MAYETKTKTKIRSKEKLRAYCLELVKLSLLAAGITVLLVLINSRTLLSAGQEELPPAAASSAAEATPVIPQADTADISHVPITPAPDDSAPLPPRTDGLPAVDTSAWYLRLVSSDVHLPSTYEPELEEIEEGEQFDTRASEPLREIIADARAAGYGVYVCSCYRSYDTQYEIYRAHINEYISQGMPEEQARASTLLAVSYPGGSEHQLGLAADLLEYQGQDMEPHVGGTGLMLWLEQHCAEYGFVIRYPYGKTNITGIEYEPWHLRYVGKEVAGYMMENGLCLEEFLALYK